MHTSRPTLPLTSADTEPCSVPKGANDLPPVKATIASKRYEDRALIGLGGMGEVRRVWDRRLHRTVAMKILRQPFQRQKVAVQRFLEEAQVAAQLTHPNILSVHDVGVLKDGRAFFTMDEVRGRTLARIIRDVHAASVRTWGPCENGWTLRRMLDAFRQVCDAMAYAHARGVLHRDLKPDNIMLGAFGEVLVMDWGLAKLITDLGSADPVQVGVNDRGATRVGAVAGTPAYMPPEQARGEHHRMDARADVYALGAILYEILEGRAPYVGKDALDQVLAGPPRALGPQAVGKREDPGPPIPTALRRLCARAMAREPHQRLAEANRLSRALAGWLDGSRKRSQALQHVAAADALAPEVERLESAARELRERAALLLTALPPLAPISEKRQAWALEARAEDLQTQAELKNVARMERLRAALNEAPDTREAHERLASHYAERHKGAENRRDARAQAALEALLDTHDTGVWSAYLKGDGRLRMSTEAPLDATVRPLVLEDRSLVLGEPVHRGQAPLDIALPHGSYVVELRGESERVYRWPVQIERLGEASPTPPGRDEPDAVRVPENLEAGEVWIPAGWTWIGGDPTAPGSGRRRKVWVHGLVMRRDPVLHTEYLDFLQALTETRGLEVALRHAPRLGGLREVGEEGLKYIVHRGQLRMGPDLDPESPVTWVSWECANAYAMWVAAKTGTAWRLPTELEWEKAARGVDGRFFPWGDRFDSAFCRVRSPHRTARAPDPIQAWPGDESVYGVRGLAGNAREWCLDPFRSEGPLIVSDRAIVDQDPWADVRAVRGGSWSRDPRQARAAARDWEIPSERCADLGFRLVYEVA